MKLLFRLLLVAIVISSCGSIKSANERLASGNVVSPVTLSIVIETGYLENNLNEVLSICNSVKPCQSFSLNNVTDDRMELRLVYNEISEPQRQELYSQLNRLGIARLTMNQY